MSDPDAPDRDLSHPGGNSRLDTKLTRDALLGLTPPVLPTSFTRVAFLDRDGVLNKHLPGYRTVDDFLMLPGAAAAVANLNASGWAVVLVTNQRGIATGKLTWDELEAVQRLLVTHLADAGAHLDAIRICPHETGTCTCRKPEPGMLNDVFTANPHIERADCVFFGDTPSDAEAALRAGVRFHHVDARDPGGTLASGVEKKLIGSAAQWLRTCDTPNS